jgi:hypothetical protein
MEIQAPTTVPCGAGTLTFGEGSYVTVDGMDASATVGIRRTRLEHLEQAAIWLQGEGEPFGFRLDDGNPIVGAP